MVFAELDNNGFPDQSFETMMEFNGYLSLEDKGLIITTMWLLYEEKPPNHEYLLFCLRSPNPPVNAETSVGSPTGVPHTSEPPSQPQLQSTPFFAPAELAGIQPTKGVYYLRLDRRFNVEANSGSRLGQALVLSSVVSSSKAVAANDDIVAGRTPTGKLFQTNPAVLHCRATFTSSSGLQLEHLVGAVLHIRRSDSMQEYTLFWGNCWAFARLLFCKLARHDWVEEPTVVMAQSDGSMGGDRGDLEAFFKGLFVKRGDASGTAIDIAAVDDSGSTTTRRAGLLESWSDTAQLIFHGLGVGESYEEYQRRFAENWRSLLAPGEIDLEEDPPLDAIASQR